MICISIVLQDVISSDIFASVAVKELNLKHIIQLVLRLNGCHCFGIDNWCGGGHDKLDRVLERPHLSRP